MKYVVAVLAALLTACNGPSVTPSGVEGPARDTPSAVERPQTALLGRTVGFSIDTPRRVKLAASQGIQATILYGGLPAKSDPLGKALARAYMGAIDGSISGAMFYWECHRTHTVAPPPAPYHNDYCRTDEAPRFDSDAAVLRYVERRARAGKSLPYLAGYWVLDDWPWWDAGSGRDLLKKVRAQLAAVAPQMPAICGFGAEIGAGTKYYWDGGTAKNYSNEACDMVGWYNYSPFDRKTPSRGTHLNWAMTGLLDAMARSLSKYGWTLERAPLLGIGQAWGGKYGGRFYQPGLTRDEVRTQALAFCKYGASSIAWYAWNDSGFGPKTETPETSQAIAKGIAGGIAGCRGIWVTR